MPDMKRKATDFRWRADFSVSVGRSQLLNVDREFYRIYYGIICL